MFDYVLITPVTLPFISWPFSFRNFLTVSTTNACNLQPLHNSLGFETQTQNFPNQADELVAGFLKDVVFRKTISDFILKADRSYRKF